MRQVRALLIFCLACPAMALAADQAKRPLEGGSRVVEVFPQQGIEHLPDAMLTHGAQQGISSVTKDPRSDTAYDILYYLLYGDEYDF